MSSTEKFEAQNSVENQLSKLAQVGAKLEAGSFYFWYQNLSLSACEHVVTSSMFANKSDKWLDEMASIVEETFIKETNAGERVKLYWLVQQLGPRLASFLIANKCAYTLSFCKVRLKYDQKEQAVEAIAQKLDDLDLNLVLRLVDDAQASGTNLALLKAATRKHSTVKGLVLFTYLNPTKAVSLLKDRSILNFSSCPNVCYDGFPKVWLSNLSVRSWVAHIILKRCPDHASRVMAITDLDFLTELLCWAIVDDNVPNVIKHPNIADVIFTSQIGLLSHTLLKNSFNCGSYIIRGYSLDQDQRSNQSPVLDLVRQKFIDFRQHILTIEIPVGVKYCSYTDVLVKLNKFTLAFELAYVQANSHNYVIPNEFQPGFVFNSAQEILSLKKLAKKQFANSADFLFWCSAYNVSAARVAYCMPDLLPKDLNASFTDKSNITVL